MDDAAVVRRGEATADLHRVVERGRERQRRSPQAWSERVALEELDGDVRDALMVADIVNREDVGVRQRGDRTGLAIEPLAHGRVGQRAGGHGLDRDLPPQPRVVRAIHLAHPAAADGLDDLVRSRPLYPAAFRADSPCSRWTCQIQDAQLAALTMLKTGFSVERIRALAKSPCAVASKGAHAQVTAFSMMPSRSRSESVYWPRDPYALRGRKRRQSASSGRIGAHRFDPRLVRKWRSFEISGLRLRELARSNRLNLGVQWFLKNQKEWWTRTSPVGTH